MAKILNCLLLALATVPVYAIARYVLAPGRALVAATLSTALPLMLYSALEMSENLAYPLALLTFWRFSRRCGHRAGRETCS